jgi:C-terminal processing protease CtpA/Prc
MFFLNCCELYKADAWDRPTKVHEPNEKFMITAKTSSKKVGINMVQWKQGYLYVLAVERGGAFYDTAVDKGDRILSINGKKAETIESTEAAESIMDEKEKITMLVQRPDPKLDKGYKWLRKNNVFD